MNKKSVSSMFRNSFALLVSIAMTGTFYACSDSDNSDKFEFTNPTVIAYADEASASVSFNTLAEWTASITGNTIAGSNESWATLKETRGSRGNNSIVVTLEKNNTGEDRSAVITIKSGESISATLTQKAINKDGIGADIANAFFISYTVDKTESLIKATDIEGEDLNVSSNFKELELSGYTWIFNESRGTALGLIYNQGNPGVGLSYSINSNSDFVQNGNGFDVASRFTSYGFFKNYAITSVCGQETLDEKGNQLYYEDGPYKGQKRADQATFNIIDLDNNSQMVQRYYQTYNMGGNSQIATFSGVADMGNGEFLTGLVISEPRAENASGGASSGIVNYPDSVWVASFSLDNNQNLVLNYMMGDDRISYASGRFRSQYYSMIGLADDDYVYVFSGSYNEGGLDGEILPTRPCGALRIKKGEKQFDKDYYFNIEELTDGYHFKKQWFITDTYFLLEFYNAKEPSRIGGSTLYGVVNTADKSFKWVTGTPKMDEVVSTGLPAAYNGKIYLPITAKDSVPAIYGIDPVTAKATKHISVNGAESIKAVGHMKYAK